MTGSENIWRLDDFQKHLFRGPTQPDIQVLRKECREGNLSHAASKIGKHWCTCAGTTPRRRS